ncbi:ankyrin repeat domain-containing protein 61 isoform X1 [Rhinatrema bivittatum]|uniref:ankyrin repeat domain-containing protein 61 isoform X1 n=1 Tax=Rhinatrema bivittatum TaxID=194408 RepID=UPI00112A645C|nr:ankyrin repeat domain-containing protein 61 isoform X1 [Rhinatrema bivittatum]
MRQSSPEQALPFENMCKCNLELNYLHAKLHEAIVKGDCDTIKTLLQTHPVNEAITIWEDCVRFPPIWPQRFSVLPIHLAATYRRQKSLLCLLESGADPDVRDMKGRTALHLIIEHWPNITTSWTVPKTKFERAMASMQNQTEACLRIMCKYSDQVNAEVHSDNRQTPLHLAVRYGAFPAISILAQNGAKVNAVDRYGMTPLHMAAGILSREMTETLISYGADVNSIVPRTGNTSLSLAVCTASTKGGKTLCADIDCIHLLLANGAKVNAQDKEGRAAIHEACFGGREEIVDLLLKFEANVNSLTKFGESPIFWFLDRQTNLKYTSLFSKLLSLSYPLKLTNNVGVLPSGLQHPEFQQQKAFLLQLSQAVTPLKDICRIKVRSMYGEKYKYCLKELLPATVCEFVYNYQDFSPYLKGSPQFKQLKNSALQNGIHVLQGT